MSLLVYMKAEQSIIMAADVKIFPLGRFGIGIVGVSEIGNALLDELQRQNIGSTGDFDKTIARIVEVSADCFNRWFGNIPPPQRPGVLLTVAGHRMRSSVPPESMIYMLASQTNFAPQLFGHMPCMSGVPKYPQRAVYLAHSYYDPSISVERAKALAEYLISEIASQDPKVGGPIHIAEIDPDIGYHELTGEELNMPR